MRKSEVLGHGHTDNVPSSIHSRLLNRTNNLLGFANTNTHLALLVTDHHNSSEMQLLASFNHLGDPPHLNHPLLKPISDLLLLQFPKSTCLFYVRVHYVDVIAQNAHATVGWTVQLLVSCGDLVLGLRRLVVEGRWGDEAFWDLRGLEDSVEFGVFVVEEGGLDVSCCGIEDNSGGS